MDSFKALLIEEPDGIVVSGFVHPDNGLFDYGNVNKRVVCLCAVDTSGA